MYILDKLKEREHANALIGAEHEQEEREMETETRELGVINEIEK